MCGAQPGGPDIDGVDLTRAAVVQGRVVCDGVPVAGAYVRLLDPAGDFVAEVPTSTDGAFRFFPADGGWTVRALARGGSAERTVMARTGAITEVQVEVPSAK